MTMASLTIAANSASTSAEPPRGDKSVENWKLETDEKARL